MQALSSRGSESGETERMWSKTATIKGFKLEEAKNYKKEKKSTMGE